MKKTITVAIPIYNGEKYVLDTLKSISNQTLKIDQLFICDNCSTDNSISIIKKFAREHPELDVKIQTNETNIGPLKNYQKCLTLPTSDFLLIIGCDDLLKPDTIEKQMRLFEQKPELALVGGNYDVVDSKGKYLYTIKKAEKTVIFQKGEILEFIEQTASWVPLSLILLNMKYIRKVGSFDDHFLGFDEIFWPRVLEQYPIAILNDTLLELRMHQEQDGSLAYINKYDEVIRYLEARKDIAKTEVEAKRRKRIKKALNRQVANSGLRMAKIVWNDYKNYTIATRFYLYSFRQAPLYVSDKYFRKSAYNLLKPVIKLVKPSK